MSTAHSSRKRAAYSTTLVAIVAAACFWIAYRGGFYGIQPRAGLAIAVWWTIAVLILRRSTLLALSRLALCSYVGLGGLALWTLVSAAWGDDNEAAFVEFDRVLLYFGIVVLASLVAARELLPRYADGFAVAITAIAVLALVSRLFPGHLASVPIGRYLPGAGTRLGYPINYWNGLATFIALGIPFLLRLAVGAKSVVARALAVVPLPLMGAVIYLTSSRGGVVAAAAGIAIFLATVGARWQAAAALACGVGGALGAIHMLRVRPLLTDGPFSSPEATRQGHHVAVFVALLCIGAGVAYLALSLAARGISAPRVLNRVALAALIVLAGLAVVASHPVRRFQAFKTPASIASARDPSQATVTGHIFSESGSGRWQLWVSAASEWRHAPVKGEGSGAFNAWWLQRNTLTRFVQDAHSLYLQTLAELGVVGLLLLLVAFVPGFIAIVVSRQVGNAASIPAFGGSFVAFAVAAGYDWMWQVTAVSFVGLAALGFLVGVRGANGGRSGRRLPRPRRIALGTAVVAVTVCIVAVEAIPALVDIDLRSSQASARSGDLATARADALSARTIEPWATSPYLQLALVDERRGHLGSAHRWIVSAIRRNPSSWASWFIAARIETKLGEIQLARNSLRQARLRNPRSAVFSSG